MSIPQNYPTAAFNTVTAHYDPGIAVIGVPNQTVVNVKEGVSIISEDGRKVITTQFDKTNTTLADVTGFSWTVLAGMKYLIQADLFITNGAGLSKLAAGGTATATTFLMRFADYANAITPTTSALGTALGILVPAGAVYARVAGYILVNAGGTLTLQFAQNAASGTSSILVGSSAKLTQVV